MYRMEIQVDKISSHPKNGQIYKLSGIEDLTSSTEELGLLEKIVIDQNNKVISGHRRLEAIKRLGWKSVPVEQITLTEDDEIKYLIHHNKQRIKTARELLNEVKVLMSEYSIGQGKRSDITSVSPNRGLTTRDIVGEMIGVSGSQIARLLFMIKRTQRLSN